MMQEEPACELTQLERMLQDHCGLCHGAPGFSQWIDCLGTCSIVPVTFAELIDARMLVPGDGEGSRLFRRLRDDSMPPPSAQLEALSERQVAQLAAFVNALEPGRPPTCEPATGPKGGNPNQSRQGRVRPVYISPKGRTAL